MPPVIDPPVLLQAGTPQTLGKITGNGLASFLKPTLHVKILSAFLKGEAA